MTPAGVDEHGAGLPPARCDEPSSPAPPDEPVLARSRAVRGLLLAAGFTLVGLAAVGVVVPLVPTTPFLLLAAACFARSSPRFYRWLLANRLFGPLIRAWRATHSIPRSAKITAIGLIVVVGGTSVVFFVTHPWVRLAVAAFFVGLIVWLLRIPTSPPRARGPG